MNLFLFVYVSILALTQRTGYCQYIYVNTLFLAGNQTEGAVLVPIEDQLQSRKVKLDITTWILKASKPFATVSRVNLDLETVHLLLISASLCETMTSSSWLRGLSTPHMCVSEDRTEYIKSQILLFTLTCIQTVTSITLTECFESIMTLPSTETILSALVNQQQWHTIVIFFEDKMDKTASSVSEALSKQSVKTVLYRLGTSVSDQQITALIQRAIELVSVEDRNFLLLCGGTYARRLLEKADEFSDRATAMRMMSSWLLLLPPSEFQLLADTSITLDNVATVVLPSLAISYPSSSSICQETQVLSLLYKPGFRQWSSVAYVNSTGQWAPFSMKRTDNNSNVIYEGICMDLLQELARTFNFTYTVREPDDGEFGRVLNRSWTGVVGLLERQDVDMAVAPLTVTQEREQVMDFIYPYYYDAGAALYKLPDKSSSKWMTLIKPFKSEVFVCIGVVILSSCFLLGTLEYITLKRKGDSKHSANIQEILTICMWHILGTFLKHGSRRKLQSRPGRILISFVWLFCIIVVAAYSGNLIAFLTVTKNNPPFRTLAEVAQQSDYTWGTDGGSMWTTLFQTSNRSDYQQIWDGIVNHNRTNPLVLSLSPNLHRKAVEDGSYLFFFDRDVIAVWAQDNCDLVLLEETFYQITYAVGLPQNSPYGLMLSQKMLSIEQSGLLQIWKGNWWPKGSSCAGDLQVQAKVIELVDLQSAFYMLGVGFGLAVPVLFIERVRNCFFPGSS